GGGGSAACAARHDSKRAVREDPGSAVAVRAFCDRSFALFPSHDYQQENSVWFVPRDWLHSRWLVALLVPVFPSGAFLGSPRSVFVDAAASALHDRPSSFLAQSAARWSRSAVHCACLLLFHCFVSGLGWDLFFRQPLFHFAHDILRHGARGFSGV